MSTILSIKNKQQVLTHPLGNAIECPRCIFFLVILMLLLNACSNFRTSSSDATFPDQSTPEAAVQSLLTAFAEGDVKAVEQLLDPFDQSNKIILKGFKTGLERGLAIEISDIETILAENDDEVARVQARFHQIIRINGEVISDERSGGLYTLHKQGDKWYFIGLGEPIPPGWISE